MRNNLSHAAPDAQSWVVPGPLRVELRLGGGAVLLARRQAFSRDSGFFFGTRERPRLALFSGTTADLLLDPRTFSSFGDAVRHAGFLRDIGCPGKKKLNYSPSLFSFPI
ncbi:hypothetical protein LSM04_008050 [Trypanosoma melophagium]|uniref:uncharacterized protein n=1 Tax=Trypanosoma melophagium TaxID=715481 RepID=UPI00351A0D77|nr:hypothetical protein LSM04_008050 [Trypanosoma melophagium]